MADPVVELWTLYALGVLSTALRTYARISAVGIREFCVDDYLIWFAIMIYTVQCCLGYSVGAFAQGLANNGMTDAQRAALRMSDPEYDMRILGSKIQVAGWTTAACLLWTLKLCVAFFYMRLTNGLDRYRIRIYIAIGLIAVTFTTVIFTVFLSCRPFHRYWQIQPDPGNLCQAAVSMPILWVSFITNVSTDVYLILIPVPMLWKSTLRLLKKIAATLVLSAGIFIIVCATLKSIYVIVDPVHGGVAAASWGTRETFVAIVTTNLPMIFPLLKTWISPYLPSVLRTNSNNKDYKSPGNGFVTIGGGGASHASRQNQNSCHVSANMTFDNDSEERIIKSNDGVRMQDMSRASNRSHPANAITVSKQVIVVTEDGANDTSDLTFRKS